MTIFWPGAMSTQEVRDDIISILKLKDPFTVTTGFDRENLSYRVIKPADKYHSLLEIVKSNRDKCGIVYCSTRKAVEEVCAKLSGSGYLATRYHAGLSDEERFKNQDDFLFDRTRVMVATNAFGMGIDKSNVSYVVHYNMPGSIESYYQEAGRAGRDGEPAECVLLYSAKDVRTNLFLIESNQDNSGDLTGEMREAVRQKDRERLRSMTFYCSTTDCLRQYILQYFGEKSQNYCGNCSNCNTHFETKDITSEAQKIASCVSQFTQRNRSFGKNTIADILHGSKNEKILRFHLDTLSSDGTHADGSTSDSALFNLLKSLRSKLASAHHVPAYIIFTDASMKDMCRKLPRTIEEFLDVSGVGDTKAKKYGKAFTEVISEYVEESRYVGGQK